MKTKSWYIVGNISNDVFDPSKTKLVDTTGIYIEIDDLETSKLFQRHCKKSKIYRLTEVK